jgi:hypothetical protein
MNDQQSPPVAPSVEQRQNGTIVQTVGDMIQTLGDNLKDGPLKGIGSAISGLGSYIKNGGDLSEVFVDAIGHLPVDRVTNILKDFLSPGNAENIVEVIKHQNRITENGGSGNENENRMLRELEKQEREAYGGGSKPPTEETEKDGTTPTDAITSTPGDTSSTTAPTRTEPVEQEFGSTSPSAFGGGNPNPTDPGGTGPTDPVSHECLAGSYWYQNPDPEGWSGCWNSKCDPLTGLCAP